MAWNAFLALQVDNVTGLANAISRKSESDPVGPDVAIRPILLQFVEGNGKQLTKILIPSPDGLTYYQAWVTYWNDNRPPAVDLWNATENPPYSGASSSNLWHMSATTQPDGLQSVRFYFYTPNSVVPYDLAFTSRPSRSSLTLTKVTRYMTMIDANKYPYVLDRHISVHPIHHYQYTYPEEVVWNTCYRLVKIEAWDDNHAECGVSLTDACDMPEGMSEDSWLAWKRSVRGISSACAILIGRLEGCCEARDTTNPASQTSSGGSTLTLIPFPEFDTAFRACAHHDETYALPLIGSSVPTKQYHTFHLRELCSRMMFSQTAVRPYLKPLRTCLATRLYTPPGNFLAPDFSGPGFYYEPEAYFYGLCVAPFLMGIDPAFYPGIDADFFSSSTTTTTGSSSTTTTTGSANEWNCPAGWFKADPIGSDPARCFKRATLVGLAQASYRDAAVTGSCADQGARLATFRSWSEFTQISAACSDQTDTASYYEAGCWLDGYTSSPTTARNATTWVWGTPNSLDNTDYLRGSDRDQFWAGEEPSAYWWWNNNLEEQCLQILVSGLLNDYPCEGYGLAAICMMNSSRM